MNHPPLVTVIVPAYNAANSIRETLNSIINQTYINLEIIVVDDGSQDQTAEIVESVASLDHRVTLLRQANKGVAAARNLAIDKSRGQYIAPIDADDIWFHDKIEKQVQLMEHGGPTVGLVYTWWVTLGDDGSAIAYSHPWMVEGEVFEAHLALNFIGNASVPLIRRACFERVGGYDPSFRDRSGQGCEDWDLSLRISEHYEIRVVPKYLTGYRRVAGSMSGNFDSMIRSHELMLEQLNQRWPKVPPKLLRWSRGQIYGYIVMIAFRMRDYRHAFRLFFTAIRSKNVSFLSPWILEVMLAKLPAAVGKPVASAMWRMSKSPHAGRPSAFVAG